MLNEYNIGRNYIHSLIGLTCDSVVACWPAPEPAQTASVGSVTSPPQTSESHSVAGYHL